MVRDIIMSVGNMPQTVSYIDSTGSSAQESAMRFSSQPSSGTQATLVDQLTVTQSTSSNRLPSLYRVSEVQAYCLLAAPDQSDMCVQWIR